MECDCNTQVKIAQARRDMQLEFPYLDEAACAPCGETTQTLAAAAAAKLPLEAVGFASISIKAHHHPRGQGLHRRYRGCLPGFWHAGGRWIMRVCMG